VLAHVLEVDSGGGCASTRTLRATCGLDRMSSESKLSAKCAPRATDRKNKRGGSLLSDCLWVRLRALRQNVLAVWRFSSQWTRRAFVLCAERVRPSRSLH
jgi:hypothetical protein